MHPPTDTDIPSLLVLCIPARGRYLRTILRQYSKAVPVDLCSALLDIWCQVIIETHVVSIGELGLFGMVTRHNDSQSGRDGSPC